PVLVEHSTTSISSIRSWTLRLMSCVRVSFPTNSLASTGHWQTGPAHEDERRGQTEQFGELSAPPLEINRLAGAEDQAAPVIVPTAKREALEHRKPQEHDQGRAQADHCVVDKSRRPDYDQEGKGELGEPG